MFCKNSTKFWKKKPKLALLATVFLAFTLYYVWREFWCEGPSLGSHLTYKPSRLESLIKSTSRRTRKEDQGAWGRWTASTKHSQTCYAPLKWARSCATWTRSSARSLWLQASLPAASSGGRPLWGPAHTLEAVLRRVLHTWGIFWCPSRPRGTCCPKCLFRTKNMQLWWRFIGYWQLLILDPEMTRLCNKVVSATPRPWTLLCQVIPRALRHTRIWVGLTTRHSTGRSWSTRGGERKGTGPWAPCGQSTRLSSGSRRGRGRPDPVWMMTSLPRTTCRAGVTTEGAFCGARPGLRVGRQEAEQELRWRERIRGEWIVTRLGCMRAAGAPGRPLAAAGVVCTLCAVLQERWWGLREGCKNLSGKKNLKRTILEDTVK